MRFLIIVALLPGVALAHEGHAPLPTKGATVRGDRLMLSASASKAIGVQVAKVELAEVRQTIRAVGSVELPWSQQAYVSTLIPGRIEQVLVKPGEAVKAGQELARVSGMELENLQLALLQALKQKTLAVQVLQGQEAAGEGIAGKVLLESRTEAQRQATRYQVAWEKLKAIGLGDETLQRVCETGETAGALPIVSPIDGIVSIADVRTGQIVHPTEHLYHIVEGSRVWIVAKVLEADAGLVKIGMPLEVTFAMLPDAYEAAIDHIDLRLNSDRTLSVKAVLDNTTGALKPGMFGRVAIQLASAKEVVCPTEALIRDAQTYVLVEQSAGNYIRKPVVVKSERGRQAVIEDGLFPGDKVVTVGSHELAALFAKDAAAKPPTSQPPAGTTAQAQIELPTDQKTFASAPIEGRIKRILVEHGQRVRKGEVLAEIDSLPFRNLQLELLQARTNLQQASRNLAMVESLGDSLARKELWRLQTERDTLRQTVASLERQLALVGASETEAVLPIRAPADGLICEFDLIPGQVVARQDQLFELHNPTKVWARAYLFEQDATRVSAGQAVQIGLASDSTFAASARIDRLDPMLLAGNRALAIWTELDNPNSQLKEGMAATVRIAER
jgi:cobalt-zinc-cadmium efflux system membrane fusion protein